MKRKLAAYIAKTIHFIIPANILLPILRNLFKVPYLGRKIVSCFDPNTIRKYRYESMDTIKIFWDTLISF